MDLIDRQAAIDAVTDELDRIDHVPQWVFDRLEERLKQLPPAQLSTDCISRQAAIDICRAPHMRNADCSDFEMAIMMLPPAQPERTCVNCGRTANNGGWYADGGTRCPIEEHYALPKDGYCHLWEKRNVTDDDYPERRTDG